MNISKVMLIFCAVVSVILAVLPHVVWVIGLAIARLCGHSLRYAPFGWTSLGLAVAFLMLMGYGYWFGRWNLQVKEVNYKNKDIPSAFHGFRIVQVSDLHLNSFDGHSEQLRRFVDSINAQNPDIVCFTGDLVTMGRSEAEPYTDILKSIHAPVYSVLGNHDFLIYERSFDDATRRMEVDSLAAFERGELGWNLLRNDHSEIYAPDGSRITIVGVDNKNCSNQGFQTIDRGDLPQAMTGVEGFSILLTHDPSHWEAEVLPDTDIPLTLSGHTHAAQVRIFGWSLAKLMFRHADGRYDEGGQTLYVNAGLGCTAPFRIGAGPEITIITLLSD